MPDVLSKNPVTDAFLQMLRTGTGRPVGDHRLLPDPVAADNPLWFERVPTDGGAWAVLYSIPGGGLSGPWGDAHADAEFVYQVTSVGKTRQQAEWMQSLVRRVVVKRNDSGGWAVPLIDAEGWSVIGRLHDEPGGGIEISGTESNFLFTAVDRFRLLVTPS